MKTICEFLADDHKRCDDLFLKVETWIRQRNWEQAETGFPHFYDALARHLDSEEAIIFPAFEKTICNAAAAIAMLRTDHQRIRGVAVRLQDALHRHDPCDFLLHAETLTILAQQHSLKEEEILYPLLDRILAGNIQHIVNALGNAIAPQAIAPQCGGDPSTASGFERHAEAALRSESLP